MKLVVKRETLINSFRVFIIMSFIILEACGSNEESDSDVILVSYRNSYLTQKEVLEQIPPGLSDKDSIALVDKIIDNWVTTQVINDLAEKNLKDRSSIDRKVDKYRNSLILREYLEMATDSYLSEPDSLDIKKFYDNNPDLFILKSPVFKGLIAKVEENESKIGDIRKLMSNPSDDNIDQIENLKDSLDIEFLYFKDNWLDWATINRSVLNEFPYDENMINKNSLIEIKNGNKHLFFYVTDFIRKGEKEPLDYVYPRISDMIMRRDIKQKENNLIRRLQEEAMADGRLKFNRN